MKKLILLASTVAVCACAPKVTVTVENTLNFSRTAELVEVHVEKLAAITLAEGQTYVVTRGGETVTSQITSDGVLLFPSGLVKNSSATFTVRAGAPAEFPKKTFGRVAPERYDDMIWENDRVAFRLYGAALQPVDGPSNGLDALYKRTDEHVLDKWYSEATKNNISYHDDHGTGLDDYKVGRTLGAGAMAPYANYRLFLNSNYTSAEVVDNGPLRTTFRLTYPDLVLTEDVTVSDEREISLDAGAQLTRVVQKFGFESPMTVAAGFPLHGDNPGAVEYSEVGDDAMMLCEPPTAKSKGVYLGLVFPQGMMNVFRDDSAGTPHALGMGVYDPAKGGYTYYTGYAWERWGEWTAAKFALYLENFTASRKTPLVVTVR